MVVENIKAWVRQNFFTKLEADIRYYTKTAADALWAAHAALTAAHGATGAVVGTTNTQTLTNKTLTAPAISIISNTGTITLPTATDTLVGRATTDTLTNKTLTSPAISSPTITGAASLNSTTGLTGTKSSVAHNSATDICRIATGGSTPLAGCFLVGLGLNSTNTSSAVMFLVSQGFSTAAIAEQAEALFGHSAVTMTAASDTANRRITLTLTQVNSSSEAVAVRISVVPLVVWNNESITLTML